MTTCASIFDCKESVRAPGEWCGNCQARASRSREIGTWIHLARVPNLDERYQVFIVTHPKDIVRIVLLERWDLIDEVRSSLLRDRDDTVKRLAAAKLKETKNWDLLRLIYEDTAILMHALAGNRHLHPRGLQLLSEHPNKEVAQRAFETMMTVMRAQNQAQRAG